MKLKQMELFEDGFPEIKITVSYSGKKKSDLVKIRTSEDIYKIIPKMFDKDTFDWTEEVVAIFLNQSNAVLGFKKVAKGGVTGCTLDPKVVFTAALNIPGTCSIILAHNHPSGNLNPSKADIDITNKIRQAAKYLDLKLLDHIIVTSEDYLSMEDQGLLTI